MVSGLGSALGRWWLAVALVLAGCDPPESPADLAFALCPNAECEPGENAANCLADCGPCAKAPHCDDQDPCTQDSCEPTSGCYHKPLTATPCPDDGPCKAESRCAAGVCVGKDRFWQQTVPAVPDAKDWIVALAAEGSSIVAVGHKEADGGAGKRNDLFLVRTTADRDSPQQAPAHELLEQDSDDDIASGVALLDGGGALVVGERVATGSFDPGGPARRAQWYKVGPAGKYSVDRYEVQASGHHGFRDVGRSANGHFLAVGWAEKQGLAMRFAADAEPGAKFAVPPPAGLRGELQAVVGEAGSNGGYVAVGNLHSADHDWHGWAVRLPAVGTEANWSIDVPAPPTKQGELRAVVAMADGGAVAMGTLGITPPYVANPWGSTVWLVRFGVDGKVVWSRTSELGSGPTRLLWLPAEQTLVAVCAGGPGGKLNDPMLLRFDLAGQLTGSSAAALGWPYAAAVLADGTLVFGGLDNGSGKHDSWIARTDAWGHAACAPKCAGLKVPDCADGNFCTLDSCSPAAGCQTMTAPSGTTCGPSSSCKETTCVTNAP